MAQAVANDIGQRLRADMVPRVQHAGRDLHFEVTINIRDGLVQCVDFSCWEEQLVAHDVQRPDALDELIKHCELWVLRALPPKLVQGYHGKVGVHLYLERGTYHLEFRIMQQRRYDWCNVGYGGNGNGRG